MTARRTVLLSVLGATGLGFGIWFAVDRSDAPLDRAPEDFRVPDYFDRVFFQGQGFPVHTRFVRGGSTQIDGMSMYVVPEFVDQVDYKNIQETPEQVQLVNQRFRPDPPWVVDDGRRRGHYKCLSTSASMVLDWFALAGGAELGEYTSVLDGLTYRGFDPKALDSLYYRRHAEDPELFVLTEEGHLDPITSTPVPYSAAGFVRIIEEESRGAELRSVVDRDLPISYPYSFADTGPLVAERLIGPEIHWEVAAKHYPREESERLRAALEEHGPLYAGLKARFASLHGVFDATRLGDLPIVGLTGHGVVIAGWIEREGQLYFLYRETFGRGDEELPDRGPSWRIYPVWCFNEVYAFRSG